MMSEQDLVEMLQIAVEDLSQDHPVALENHDETDDADKPERKRQRLEISCLDTLIKVMDRFFLLSYIPSISLNSYA
uniref:Uncharacterized protein n=1 Tax=Erpetoichthys calabaricus TaxID=27687 RepID=A0A8C4S261_ERPCA